MEVEQTAQWAGLKISPLVLTKGHVASRDPPRKECRYDLLPKVGSRGDMQHTSVAGEEPSEPRSRDTVPHERVA
jgi:hypothetical protein